ncbi:dimethylhistidine N-methyltransferase [Sphingomonas naasensis]|uniref:L-histidine N(Alpha)-methyltransferase n=1 Tax=Sphingomonas naasensis TaxID=1344951 RepID=A0A4S1WI10_9SPHN|nr:L-histidine N(alpha)-methyltransferase [Sphingomonas naasensis]NIJ22008.1 dimethylhistidine N-methyltransferase [Sphingomonas naasensis]TGX42313.1 L-histidine N(alpha)-methyltransferase [Sphingomonas naasensis]
MLKQEMVDGERGLADPNFRADVLNGLAATPRAIPARWFYDRRGSELFEAITDLPEYYPTRTETALLMQVGPQLGALAAPNAAIVEFGSGSSTKTPILLRAIDPAAYVPIDISGEFLRHSAAALSQAFPGLPVHPVEADFLRPVPLPTQVAGLPKLGFFPGSTIGNMNAFHAVNLLRAMREWLGEGARLLIGMDRVKSPDILIPAYDDAQGVTAAFNRNLLERINRELAGTIPVDAFRHRAIWNAGAARIEMHLEAQRDVAFTVEDRPFAIAAGETIHTENSHKYGPNGGRMLLRAGGWTPIREWTDPQDWFALALCEAQPLRMAP